MAPTPHIGTLREKPLHAALKRWYSQDGDRVEAPVDEFVVDLVRGKLLIEVQTSGFSSMKKKVATLLDRGHRLRIVHPIPVNKWIVKVDGNGAEISRRRSPKHGSRADLFTELVSFPELMAHTHLEIDLVMTDEEEVRSHSPGRSWRRGGWIVDERRLLEVLETSLIRNSGDLAALLPAGLPDPFTTADLATKIGGSRRVAQQMSYCLRNVEAIVAVGKAGNAVEYRVQPVD